jgi:hypothetical protein
MSREIPPVLIIGGSGIVGSRTAHLLRSLYPDLPIALGGRDVVKAEAVAEAVGGAKAVKIDLSRSDLGQQNRDYSAVAIYVKDDRLNAMRYAQTHGLPYVSVSSGTFEMGPEVAQFIHHPAKAPILMASQWLAGAATLPTLFFARDFRKLESIRIGVLLDEEDMGGPAAYADYERLTSSAPAALRLEQGVFTWVKGEAAKSIYTSVDGTELPATAYSPFDIISLAAATDAPSIRLDLVLGVSASRRQGRKFSTEVVIELEGQLASGQQAKSRHAMVHPEGQAPLTALGVSLALERLLGLAGGEPVAPGLYLPEVLLEPAYFVERMKQFGTQFHPSLRKAA